MHVEILAYPADWLGVCVLSAMQLTRWHLSRVQLFSAARSELCSAILRRKCGTIGYHSNSWAPCYNTDTRVW